MSEAVVLDSSAVLALLAEEAGADQVAALIPSAAMSAVNVAEVLVVLARHGVPPRDAERVVEGLGLRIVDAGVEVAQSAARLRGPARGRALALGDRFCLATAALLGVPAVTADRAWARVATGVSVRVIR